MRFLIIATIAGAALMAGPSSVRPSLAACNYDNDAVSNCGDAINDYFNKTIGHQTNSYDDVQNRVDSAKDTLQQCYDCAMDKVEQGANSSTSTSTSTGSDDSQ